MLRRTDLSAEVEMARPRHLGLCFRARIVTDKINNSLSRCGTAGRDDGDPMRQAVLLIHGIGEQRPMETLRGFVESIWTTDKSVQLPHPDAAGVWSKPYTLSQNFELRRLTTAENKAGIRTDFFELYCAHLMRGTKVAHVVGWAKTLLIRRPSTVPRQLRLAYYTCWALVVVGVVLAYHFAAAKASGQNDLPVWASLVLSLAVIPAVMGILLNFVGDAARYLHVAPPNVGCRRAIRAMGVGVLRSLHERGYDRIIVVGHSLGSVIGYDILSFAWNEFNAVPPTSRVPSYDALTALEELTIQQADGATIDETEFRAAQRRYFNEFAANGSLWRVTDFVTLGSPLAHAHILIGRDAGDFRAKCGLRELATCPPTLEISRASGGIRRFSYPLNAKARTPHQAAVFGPTRWTNLYFPCKALVRGDLVGGPLRGVFGHGIRDVAVTTRIWNGLFSHTHYWDLHGDNGHVQRLREAIDLLDSRG